MCIRDRLLVARHVNDRVPAQLFKGDEFPGDALAAALLILASLVGQMVMARLVARDGTEGQTLGALLRQAIALLPAAVAVTLILGIGTGFGLFLFVIPGIWLYCRLLLVLPLVATGHRDPLEAVTTSWALTKGQALKIFGMVAILLFGFLLLAIGINGVGAAAGVISTLATGKIEDGWSFARWLFEVIGASASSAMGVFYIAFQAVLMQALKSNRAAAG